MKKTSFRFVPSSTLGTCATAIGFFFLGEILRHLIDKDNIFITSFFAFLSGTCLGFRGGYWYCQYEKDKKQPGPSKTQRIEAAAERNKLLMEYGHPVTANHNRVCERCLTEKNLVRVLEPFRDHNWPDIKFQCPVCGARYR